MTDSGDGDAALLLAPGTERILRKLPCPDALPLSRLVETTVGFGFRAAPVYACHSPTRRIYKELVEGAGLLRCAGREEERGDEQASR